MRLIIPTTFAILTTIVTFTANAAAIAPVAHNAVVMTAKTEPLHSRIVTANGVPVDNAIITFVNENNEPMSASARSDANGEFVLPSSMSEGTYRVRIIRLGFRPIVFSVTQRDGAWEAPTDITMQAIAFNL